jgi:hypothetical protein
MVDSVATAYKCASKIAERSDDSVRAQAVIKLSRSFKTIGNCARRAPASLRRDLDRAIVALVRSPDIDVETVEAIFEIADEVFTRHAECEAAQTALSALGSWDVYEIGRIPLKVQFESLSSSSHYRIKDALNELMLSIDRALTGSQVFHVMAGVFKTEVILSNPEIASLVVDYVQGTATLWRAQGLHPTRARDAAHPNYVSHFHRYVDLVLTAVVEPWVRRHDDDVDSYAEAVWDTHAQLSEELKAGVSSEPGRADRELLVSEDHLKRVFANSSQKSGVGTP